MLDFLMAVIEELFGQKRPQAQPRRRVRTASDSQPSEAPPARRGAGSPRQWPEPPEAENPQPSLEDMMRRFFGSEEDAEEGEAKSAEAAPAPLPPPARPRPPAAAASEDPDLKPVYGETPRLAGQKAAETGAAAPAPARAVPEFAARLRSNPAAARQAFVYAEIFGPPLANRH